MFLRNIVQYVESDKNTFPGNELRKGRLENMLNAVLAAGTVALLFLVATYLGYIQ